MSRTRPLRRGASAIEFALCMPFVVLLLGGLVDGGLHLATMHAVSRAARDGARIGSTTSEPFPATGDLIIASATAAARASITGAGFSTGNYSVTASWTPDSNDLYWVRVTVSAEQEPLFGSMTPFGGTLTQEFVMVTQEQP